MEIHCLMHTWLCESDCTHDCASLTSLIVIVIAFMVASVVNCIACSFAANVVVRDNRSWFDPETERARGSTTQILSGQIPGAW